jgi:cell division protein FtsQ
MAAREVKKGKSGIRWRLWLGLAALGIVCASTAMAAIRVRRFMLSDSQFTLSHGRKDALSIQGLKYASRWRVEHVFAPDFGRSVFHVPLEERRRRLCGIDWVEDASVSRVWPDRLVVRVHERTPVAFVYFRAGIPQLIDSYGVLLELPPKAQFSFPVLSGVSETGTEAQLRAQVAVLLDVERDMGYLMRDVSEVNVADPEDIRFVAQVERRTVDLMMGDGNFALRYQNFVSHYPEIQKRSPEVKTFDLRLDDRITAKE